MPQSISILRYQPASPGYPGGKAISSSETDTISWIKVDFRVPFSMMSLLIPVEDHLCVPRPDAGLRVWKYSNDLERHAPYPLLMVYTAHRNRSDKA
jgi:hypothetical protein